MAKLWEGKGAFDHYGNALETFDRIYLGQTTLNRMRHFTA
jgi:hypothetical protein